MRPAQAEGARHQHPRAHNGDKGGDESNADLDHRAPWCLIEAVFV
jgi:hypothetical protein